jgi:ornithine decarboxylase
METIKTSTQDISVDLSQQLIFVEREEKKKKCIKFNTKDIYEIISYFLSIRTNNESFFIADLGEVVRKYEQWTKNLPRVEPFYAIKSNPDPMLIFMLAQLGVNFDVASKNEIAQVLSYVNSKRIIYANPCKESSYIQYARTNDVDLLTFDSECELDKIKLSHPEAKLIIRIKVDDSGSVCRFNSKFGCSFEEVDYLLSYAKTSKLYVVGLSFHLGSNLKELGYFEKAIKLSREVFTLAHTKYEYNFTILDIGGGFPGISNTKPSFEEIANEINNSIDMYFNDIPNLRIIAEPGRFFSTSVYTFVFSIIGIKKSINNDEEFYNYTVNNGIYSCFNCIKYDYAEPLIQTYNERSETTYKSLLFGQTCDSLDVISKEVYLPKLTVGDCLFSCNMGSYSMASSSLFNGFELPMVHYIYT